MEFQSRSYNPGPVFRPKPFVLQQPEQSLLVVTTSWSAQGEAEKAAQMISQHIEQNGSGGDVLREALSAAAQQIYKQDNLKQARLLIEAVAVQVRGHLILWAQTGQPNLYLLRRGRMAPLVVQPDHSLMNPGLPPLPVVGLGLEAQTPIQSGTASWQPGDQLVMLAQAWDPAFPLGTGEEPSFQRLTTELIQRQPDLAFWCGQVSF